MKIFAVLVGIALGLVSQASTLDVPAGIEVRLVLMSELNSGGSVLGQEVPFLVSEDVRVDGRVVIREGTVAVGRVRQVRREGAFSAMLFDKPSRLAVELEETWDVDGRPVRIQARMNGKERLLYHFNRSNTKIPKLDPEVKKVLDAPQKRRALELLVDALKGSRSIADLQDNLERGVIMEVARALRLSSTAELLLNNRIMDLVTLGTRLHSPGLAAVFAARAAVGAVQTTFRAAKEIAHVATHLPGFLSRKFGGRNINAPVGLELSVFTA